MAVLAGILDFPCGVTCLRDQPGASPGGYLSCRLFRLVTQVFPNRGVGSGLVGRRLASIACPLVGLRLKKKHWLCVLLLAAMLAPTLSPAQEAPSPRPRRADRMPAAGVEAGNGGSEA